MSKIEVIDEGTWNKVLHELRTNSDFFDPLYLSDPDLYNPLQEADIIEVDEVPHDEVWTIVNFLQLYSDVDLLSAAKAPKDQGDARGLDDFEGYVMDWYRMYLVDTTIW